MKLNELTESEIATAKRTIKQSELFYKASKPDFDLKIDLGLIPRLTVFTLDDVLKCKRWAQENLGAKKYRINTRFYCRCCITTWISPYSEFAIWFECSIEDYPPELSSESCNWETTITTKTIQSTNYICNI